jgi:hypothetical protein
MVKHRLSTRWPDEREKGWRCVWSAPWTKRRGACVSWLSLKTKVVGFFGLSLKTDSYDLVICATKLTWRFLGLGLKTKWVMIYRLCHKTDGRMKTTQDTRQDLVACFIWKQVRLSQSGLKTGEGAARLLYMASSRRSCRNKAEDGRIDMMCCIVLFYLNFIIFIILVCKGNFIFWLGL